MVYELADLGFCQPHKFTAGLVPIIDVFVQSCIAGQLFSVLVNIEEQGTVAVLRHESRSPFQIRENFLLFAFVKVVGDSFELLSIYYVAGLQNQDKNQSRYGHRNSED